MKNLVLEAHAEKKQTATSSSDGYPVSGRGGSSEDTQKLIKQVNDMKSLLLQRDNEISILVNMVKKGKTADDVEFVQKSLTSEVEEAITDHRNRSNRESDMNRGGKVKDQVEKESLNLAKEREQKIIKRTLFGVPPPTDLKIFDDAAGIGSP